MKRIATLVLFAAITLSATFSHAQSAKQLVARANNASATCHNLRRQVARLANQLKRQQQASVCTVQRGKIRKLRVQAVLLRRSIQQICGVIDRHAANIASTARNSRGCGSCLVFGECGSCHTQSVSLRRSCQRKARSLRRQGKQLKKLEAECSSASRSFGSLVRQVADILPRTRVARSW